ncbi:MAG: MipA/OmpV family protein [Desulfotignum sp.]
MKKSKRSERGGRFNSLGLYMLLTAAVVMIQFQLSSARASDLIIPIEIAQKNFFGMGMGAYPDYFGSDDTAFGLLPMGRISFSGERYVSLLASDLRINLIDSPNWRLGPDFYWRFGRKDVDDTVVDRIHEIDGSAEIGLFGGYVWKDPQEVRRQAGVTVSGLWDVSSEHDGWTGGVNVFGMYPVTRPVTIAGGAGFTYASDEYTNTYFGVTTIDATASGLPTYTADGGTRDGRVWLSAILSMSLKWHFAAGVMYSRLLGDAADSPIVKDRGSENQWIYGFGVIYAW